MKRLDMLKITRNLKQILRGQRNVRYDEKIISSKKKPYNIA